MQFCNANLFLGFFDDAFVRLCLLIVIHSHQQEIALIFF